MRVSVFEVPIKLLIGSDRADSEQQAEQDDHDELRENTPATDQADIPILLCTLLYRGSGLNNVMKNSILL